MRPAQVLLVNLALLVLGTPGARAETPTPPAGIHTATTAFVSGGKRITVWRFEPADDGKHPAVLLLCGLDSMESQQKVFADVAKRYAAKGYVVLLVNYFNRTDTRDVHVKAVLARFKLWLEETPASPENSDLAGLFQAWTAVVRDAVAHARTLPNVDGQRIGPVGFSLGAFLAMAAAAQEDLQIGAVVEFFGGLPRTLRPGVKTLPPVLIIHGDRDAVVPVAEAHQLAGLLAARKLPHEVQIYPGVGHVFANASGGLNWAAALDAEGRTGAFLEKYLKRVNTRGKKKCQEQMSLIGWPPRPRPDC
jgi:carboxymethylenebutenolidase